MVDAKPAMKFLLDENLKRASAFKREALRLKEGRPHVSPPRHPVSVKCQLTEKRPDIREASKIAVDKSPSRESFTFPDMRAPCTYHNCKMCLLRDMQEMISTVKLDDRATAACGSKNGKIRTCRTAIDVC